jgi:hypothetical protein
VVAAKFPIARFARFILAPPPVAFAQMGIPSSALLFFRPECSPTADTIPTAQA